MGESLLILHVRLFIFYCYNDVLTGYNNKIYYEDLGNVEGSPIIFIHGWASDHHSLKNSALKTFGDKYRCVFVDLLGYGKSEDYELDTETYICEQNARQIYELIAALDLYDVIIYGNCMGGNIGMFLPLITRIKAFVWIDGFLFFENKFLPFVTPIIRKPFYRFFFQESLGLNIVNLFLKYADEVPEQMLHNTNNIRVQTSLDYLRDLQRMHKERFIESIAKISCPTLFICGEKTLSGIKKSQLHWHRSVLQSSIDHVPGGKHLVVAEKPDELNQKIFNYLEKVDIEQVNT